MNMMQYLAIGLQLHTLLIDSSQCIPHLIFHHYYFLLLCWVCNFLLWLLLLLLFFHFFPIRFSCAYLTLIPQHRANGHAISTIIFSFNISYSSAFTSNTLRIHIWKIDENQGCCIKYEKCWNCTLYKFKLLIWTLSITPTISDLMFYNLYHYYHFFFMSIFFFFFPFDTPDSPLYSSDSFVFPENDPFSKSNPTFFNKLFASPNLLFVLSPIELLLFSSFSSPSTNFGLKSRINVAR